MKALLIGTVRFSASCLSHLIAVGAPPAAVVTRKASRFHADFAPLGPTCREAGIPCHVTSNVNDPTTVSWMRDHRPEVIYCFGWSQILGPAVLSLAPRGVIGYHPALLPANRGRHPIIWALALGLKETGSTFFGMDEGVDSGEIVSQRRVPIDENDDAATLYDKLTATALSQIDDMLPVLADGSLRRIPQDPARANRWRKRGPEDGRIDWRMSSRDIHNLVRALTRPYPGATVRLDGDDHVVWCARVGAPPPPNIEPGKVLAVDGPEITVKSGDGAVILVEHELSRLPAVGAYL